MTTQDAARSFPPAAQRQFQEARLLHKQGQLYAAERQYRALLQTYPGHMSISYGLALVCIQQRRFAEAADVLNKMVKAAPEEPEIRYHLGHVLNRLGRPAEALVHLEKSVSLAPERAETYTDLANVLVALRRPEDALANFTKAIELNPSRPEPYSNLGGLLTSLGRFDEAIIQLEKALALAPGHPLARYNLATTLTESGRFEEAIGHFEKLLENNPRHVAGWSNYAKALASLARYDEALMAYEQATKLDAELASARYGVGTALQQLGRLEEAAVAYRRAVEMSPRNPMFHRALADTKRFTEDDAQLAALEDMARESANMPDSDRIELDFALAKAYSDLDRYARSFEHLRNANTRKRANIFYDEAAELDCMALVASTFSKETIARLRGSGVPSELPIFVVGMPRSGSSLVEQMLSSHPRVFGAGEIKTFGEIFAGGYTPANVKSALASLSAESLRWTGTEYLARASALAPTAARVVDKLLGNILYVGAIHLALPGARIIHVRRDPLDSCFSCYTKVFAGRLNYAYDLGELGRYYKACEKLMKHWAGVLPENVILEVQYETLVENFEAEARRIVAHCGLAWSPQCLAFHETQRAVRTASAYQVREPLFKESIGRWKPYAEWLTPLMDALKSE